MSPTGSDMRTPPAWSPPSLLPRTSPAMQSPGLPHHFHSHALKITPPQYVPGPRGHCPWTGRTGGRSTPDLVARPGAEPGTDVPAPSLSRGVGGWGEQSPVPPPPPPPECLFFKKKKVWDLGSAHFLLLGKKRAAELEALCAAAQCPRPRSLARRLHGAPAGKLRFIATSGPKPPCSAFRAAGFDQERFGTVDILA